MTVKNKKKLFIGIFLGVSFWGILAVIFSPVFGDGKNGLQFADDMFNKLAKGSSYFIPETLKKSEKFTGKHFSLSIKFDKQENAQRAAKQLAKAGASARVTDGSTVAITGDLGKLLSNILQDSDAMFKNDGGAISKRYGSDEKETMTSWWNILKDMDKALKKSGQIAEAKIVSDVMKKAVEPAYNFYNIESQKVSEKAGIMSGLLVFYVIYTMWWGFSIFYIFEGLGLTMTKAKVKREV